MAKSKVESEKNVAFAKGGTTPMFGTGDRTTASPSDQAGPAAEARTGKVNDGGGGGKFASGGSGKMFGYNPSVPATAGKTSAR